ncbi:MAG: SAM-dependent DNA methyltransferase [Planctomycetia bacterium]|nr:SAM-dependent DNA methyltransferase [Planctomycetia bacterium]
MKQSTVPTINEVDFCGKMATAATTFFANNPGRCPFIEARIEGLGSSRSKNARKDLRFYGPNQKILLTGEVKLPGNTSAFDSKVVKDAHDKAEEAIVQYFFTWDVNTFVLWDRSQWKKPLLERRMKVWQLRLNLASPQEVARTESLDHIEKRFLPDLLLDLSDIVSGLKRDWALPQDEVFLRSLESHLEWPVALLRLHLHQKTETDKGFDLRLQEWMVTNDLQVRRTQPDEWRKALDTAARSLAYIWTNRLIFYKALRARFPELPKLELGSNIKNKQQALRRLDDLFTKAAKRSGDYESLLFPETHDWANELVFVPEGSVDAWRGFLRGIESVDFHEVSSDVIGLIFQKLVSPETRHRYGQHFTGPDPVDLINSFCIRKADAKVLDPACGSGSFLVRAYYRKRAMNSRRSHVDMLGDLFGCDVSLYPAHLATLNLAAREINDEANYPRIERRDFFDIKAGKPFCHIPEQPSGEQVAIKLPELDAVVGNPPYVRQEKIAKKDKPKYAKVVDDAFKGTELSGRADLHCYFWPHAARFLKEGAAFGFLTSGQWLDVDYGFDLQRWILKHFKIIAIMESSTERWFPDARVKTCITILERCSDEADRRKNTVRFVRFEKPLADIIGKPATGGVGEEAEDQERIRQQAVDRVRDAIERSTRNCHDDRWRILVKRQGDLWDDGVRVGAILKDVPVDESDEEDDTEQNSESLSKYAIAAEGDYAAGKWGRYLRAPDLYFEIMERIKGRLVPLGQIVDIRFGVKTGCDAFFMPKDVTDYLLEQYPKENVFLDAVGISRKKVSNGSLKIIEDGDGTYHPIEPQFIRPEVHSLMKVDRPVVRENDLDRVVLLVKSPLSAIKGTFAYRYVKYGEQATYASTKSKAVPVPERSTCAARDPWYDLTKLVNPGFAFWPKSQQYRHIIPANPKELVCNCNLYDLGARELNKQDQQVLVAIINSTLIGLFKTFYGRYAGTEGNLKTEVIDVNLIEVPDPRGVDNRIGERLKAALRSISSRVVEGLVEEELKECHTYQRAIELSKRPITLPEELKQSDRRELDDAVFELLGVADQKERSALVDRLYEETTLHFRDVRVTEIQKMEDRRKGGSTRFGITDQAADVWDALDLSDMTPLTEWVTDQAADEWEVINIPSERPVYLSEDTLFDAETVYFGRGKRQHMVCQSRGEAELVARMADLGVSDDVTVPKRHEDAQKLLKRLNDRHLVAVKRLSELAASRSGDSAMQDDVFKLLERWYVLGKPTKDKNR